jgi:hypothetical protein
MERAEGGMMENRPHATKMACDFCGVPNPIWEFRCKDFSYWTDGDPRGEIVFEGGGWASCAECRALIESGDKVSLLAKDMDSKGRRGVFTMPVLKALVEVGELATDYSPEDAADQIVGLLSGLGIEAGSDIHEAAMTAHIFAMFFKNRMAGPAQLLAAGPVH